MSKVEPASAAHSVNTLRGVGPERTGQLERLGVRTVFDLLLLRPRRYEDRRRVEPICDLTLNNSAMTRGRVVASGIKRYRRGQKSVFEMILDDGTGRLHCRWWNMPYLQDQFCQGDEILVFGKLNSIRPRTMDHPETEAIEGGDEISIHLNRIAPIYPLTEGLSQRWLRTLVWRTLESHAATIDEPWPHEHAPDFLTRRAAVLALHFPSEIQDADAARARLALDEFVELQRVIQTRRKNLQAKARGWPCAGHNRLIKQFLSQLGFKLTAAQTRVLKEIRRDMSGGQPMRRLLQGDVGAGKTVVAALGALMALESGFNVVMMAPTEVLAEQHFATFSRWFEALAIDVRLRTGTRDQVTSPVAPAANDAPRLALTIGTHALIEDSFAVEQLGLVIIDEQHKFGVAQRETLVRKGYYPHLLVMTATPIPRTLGLTLYGDLDISILDELPSGRLPVKTYVRTAEKLPEIWKFIRSKLADGQQAYVVYPRVEETDASTLKAVVRECSALRDQLRPHKVGLLHGQLSAQEKEQTMAAFRNNDLHVLLTTSIVEVGLDVPNATVMLIENAERFGLAQLHQLRGRIGRGTSQSFCILVAAARKPEIDKRLQVLAETADGFKIAEADLKLRGSGDLLGHAQSGLPPLLFGDLANDGSLIERSRGIAAAILSQSVV